MASGRPQDLAKVRKRFDCKHRCDLKGCWLWTAATNNRGYGVIGFGGGNKIVLAHRLSWILHNGEIPDGQLVLHKCDVRACVNPDHLYLGNMKDNARDHMERGDPYIYKLHERRHEWDDIRTAAMPRGKNHHRSNAKINESIARQIFLATGSQREIAERFGLCQQAVSKIKTLKTWGHVNG